MSRLREIEDMAGNATDAGAMAHAQVMATLAVADAISQAAATQLVGVAAVAEQVERVAVTLDSLHGIIETGTPITVRSDGGAT